MLMLMTVLAAAVAAPPAPDEAPRPCPRVEVRQATARVDSRHARARRVPRKAVFSAREVGDLELVVSSPRRLAEEQLELRLLAPGGHLYQTLRVPLPEPDLERRDPWGRASVTLPVSGTLIEKSALFGVWSVQPVIDGTPLDCPQLDRFTLER